jgi:hypothetical protein
MDKGNIKRGNRNQKKNFTMVSNEILNDNRLSWKAKGILSYLLSKPDGWEAQIEDLYKKASDGYSSLRSGIDDLILCGYMELKNVYNEKEGKFTGRYYEFNEVPLFSNKFRMLDNKNRNYKKDEILLDEDPRPKNRKFIKK